MASKPFPTLLVLTPLVVLPLASAPLVLAQAEPAASPAAAAEPASPPPAVAAPVAQPAPAPLPAAAAPPPLPPITPSAPTATTAPRPVRTAPEQFRVEAPRRASPVDVSIDALVRDGVITPGERVRVRGGFLIPSSAGISRQACSSGALSAQECSTGLVFRGRARDTGETASYGGGAGAGDGPALAAGGLAGGERYGIDASPLPPISVPVGALLSGVGGSFRLTDVFRVTPRPGPILGNGNAGLLFPLIGSAVTTSGFGWRLHPLLGSWIMHSGRDLAAPEGTPVVAALTGRVVSSGLAGGYGLAIEIEHDNPRRRTLYGHLSELYVKEGDTVRQGEVIGRVGSTGLSTGPHLHFEVRLPQEGGWVAIDPGDLDPGGSLIAGLQGLAGTSSQPGEGPIPDAVALLVGELVQTLERPRSPLPLPGEKLPAPASGRPSAG